MSHSANDFVLLRRGMRGFSLVELLIIVTIIAILAAFLLPVLNSTRERGRRTACLSNLKQIGLSLEMYISDSDSYFPNTFFGAPFPGQKRWMDTLEPYARSKQIFTCPSAPELVYQTGATNYGGYAYNGAYYNRPVPDVATPPCSKWDHHYGVKSSEVSVPAKTLWVCDAAGNFEISWGENVNPQINATLPRTFGPFGLTNMVIGRHQNFINVLWCDGHVKSQNLDELVRKNEAGLARAFTIQDD